MTDEDQEPINPREIRTGLAVLATLFMAVVSSAAYRIVENSPRGSERVAIVPPASGNEIARSAAPAPVVKGGLMDGSRKLAAAVPPRSRRDDDVTPANLDQPALRPPSPSQAGGPALEPATGAAHDSPPRFVAPGSLQE